MVPSARRERESVRPLDVDATNVLLISRGDRGAAREAVRATVLDGLTGRKQVLHVATARTSGAIIEERYSGADAYPSDLAIVSAADRRRSGLAGEDRGVMQRNPYIRPVAAPDALSEIGTATSEIVEGWADTRRESLVEFDAVDDVLERVDAETAFRFFHLLCARVERAGATGYYHLGGEFFEEVTAGPLRQLFDGVVICRTDGRRTVVSE